MHRKKQWTPCDRITPISPVWPVCLFCECSNTAATTWSSGFEGSPESAVSSMQIYPAIDLRDGKCVRLRQGDYAQETVFGDDPAAMAARWVADGATFLHLVDLDGAKEGRPINGPSVQAIIAAAGVPCQVGGGIRTEEDIREVLGWGVTRVIVGTKALTTPTWLDEMTAKFPGQLVL